MATLPYFLYAEDDEDDVVLMRDMLALTNSSKGLISVKDGFEAIKFLEQVKPGELYPSLIILDINMPRLNGPDTLEILKGDDMYCLIPVVMLSITSSDENDMVCRRYGSEVLAKPHNFNTWVDVLKRFNGYVDDDQAL